MVLNTSCPRSDILSSTVRLSPGSKLIAAVDSTFDSPAPRLIRPAWREFRFAAVALARHGEGEIEAIGFVQRQRVSGDLHHVPPLGRLDLKPAHGLLCVCFCHGQPPGNCENRRCPGPQKPASRKASVR